MWLASFYTSDGVVIHGLVHNELRANIQPWICPSRDYGRCGYPSIVAAISSDRGQTFHALPPPGGIVATSPYRYEPDAGNIGYMGVSNILAYDGYYYLAFGAVPFRAQPGGVCLMRTRTLDDPSSWRAWDGAGFTVAFVDPYTEANVVPQRHVCHPLGLGNIGGVSLLQHVPDGTFIMIGVRNALKVSPLSAPGPGGSHPVPWVAISRNLTNWYPEAPLLSPEDEARLGPLNYPVLFDETSTDRNFSTVGNSPELIYVHSDAPDNLRTRDVWYVHLRLNLSMP